MATPRAFDTTHLTTCYPSSEPREDNPWEPASIGTIAAAPLLMDFELAEPDHDPGSGSPRDATGHPCLRPAGQRSEKLGYQQSTVCW